MRTITSNPLGRLTLLLTLALAFAGSAVGASTADAGPRVPIDELPEEPPTPAPPPPPVPAPAPAPPPPPPATPSGNPTASVFTSAPLFKSCHGMRTEATLHRDLNRFVGTTETWSDCWLGGFTGHTIGLLVDAEDRVVDYTIAHKAGVNGQWEASMGFGTNRWKQHWQQEMDPRSVQKTHRITIEHSPAPTNRLHDILDFVVSGLAKVADVKQAIENLR